MIILLRLRAFEYHLSLGCNKVWHPFMFSHSAAKEKAIRAAAQETGWQIRIRLAGSGRRLTGSETGHKEGKAGLVFFLLFSLMLKIFFNESGSECSN